MPGSRGLRRIEQQWLVWLTFGLVIAVSGLFLVTGFWELAGKPWISLTVGVALCTVGLWLAVAVTRRLFWEVLTWSPQEEKSPEMVKALQRGPKIVVVGGGSGLGTILRGLKHYTANLTAIVTVADDGGSSGRLRKEFGILPPGDIRNCLIALADLEPLMEKLLQFRFNGGTGLAGHSFGNLFLAAMTEIEGDYEQAIRASSQVLAVRGRVIPATLENVVLTAELDDGTVITGESAIGQIPRRIRRLRLEPDDVSPVPQAIEAIKDADIIILGPGSLFTSVIPNLLVRETAEAIRASSAIKVYVCNAMTEYGETVGFTASDHVRAIIDHAGPDLIDYVLINTREIPEALLERYRKEGAEPVQPDTDKIRELGPIPLGAPLILTKDYVRHDADRLARIVLSILRTQGKLGVKTRVVRRLRKVLKI